MSTLIDNKFEQKQKVFLLTDPDQKERIITAICIRGNLIQYELAYGDRFSWHQEFEIKEEQDVLKSTRN